MAAPSNTYVGYNAVGIREDLSDIIYDISPTDTPFMTNIARDTASQTLHEWQTDTLAAAALNAVIEGDEATTDARTATTRYANYTMISDKVPRVSGTLRASDTAGRRDEMSYQVAKSGRELKRDIEFGLCGTQQAAAGDSASARQLGGLGVWLWDNMIDTGTGGTLTANASGAPLDAITTGTAVAFTEAHLTSMLAACWDDGGDPSLILMRGEDKRLASAFSGIATQYRDNAGSVGPAVVVGAADIYVSDWGTHYFVASRFMPAGAVYGIDPEYWCVSYLRPIQQTELAKTGDSDRMQILAEYTLTAKNPQSSGMVWTTSSGTLV